MEIATALPQPQEQKAKTVIEQFREEFRKEGLEKGMKEGLEKGMKEGLEKGIEKGMEKGIEVAVEKSIRHIMLKRPQFSNEEIADLLDVSLEMVQKVRASLQQS